MSRFSRPGAPGLPPQRTALVAAAAVFAASLGAAGPLQAYSGPGSFDPLTTAPVYPATTTPVHGWKIVRVGETTVNSQLSPTASIVQIAPRWTMQSLHAGVNTGDKIITTSGQSVQVLQTYVLQQKPLPEGDGTASDDRDPGFSDVTLSYLAADAVTKMPAPAGGFPLLLKDQVGPDIDSVLPGYTLWAGLGGSTSGTAPRVGWTRPNGLNVPNGKRVVVVGGDSGSGALWYRSATARPVVASTATYGTKGAVAFGRETMFGTKLAPGGGNHATIADWMQSVFNAPAADGATGVVKPEWATFSSLGINFGALKPPAPRKLRIVSGTGSSVTVAWDHPSDTRIPRDGYRVSVEGGASVTVSAGATQVTVPVSIPAGGTGKVTVKAYNANGESPLAGTNLRDRAVWDPASLAPESDTSIIEPDDVAPFVPAAPDLSAEGRWQFSSRGKIDYCVRATWPALTAPGGEATGYQLFVDGLRVKLPGDTTGWEPSSYTTDPQPTAVVCGLDPSAVITTFVRGVHRNVVGPSDNKTVTLPAGPAAGTLFPAAALQAPVARRVVRSGAVDYCLDLAWTAPATVPGYPVLRYDVEYWPLLDPTATLGFDVPTQVSAEQVCHLDPAVQYAARVTTVYGTENGANPYSAKGATTPAGPAVGTALPFVTGVAGTATRAALPAGGYNHCVTGSWTVAPTLASFPPRGYSVRIVGADGTNVSYAYAPGQMPGSVTLCGLRASTMYWIGVGATYDSDGEAPQLVGTTKLVTTLRN